jgi:endoglucanase
VDTSSDRRHRKGRLLGISLLGAAASAGLLAGVLAGPAVAATPALDAELIVNGDFSSGDTAPWWWTEDNPATVVDGQLCAPAAAGTVNPWDAIIGQDAVALTAGTAYTLTYTASATSPVTITTNVQENVDPYTQISTSDDALTAEPQTFTQTFTPTEDNDAAQLVFQFGGGAEDLTFCVDDVSITDGATADGVQQ